VSLLLPEPFQEFAAVFERAKASVPVDPNSMVLSTVGPDGRPSSRVILLKGFDAAGFVFYTNLTSQKGRELAQNPLCALNFHWKPLEKQVRIEGRAERVSDPEADAYFASRPRGSQLGAWASQQSATLASRAELEERYRALEQQYAGMPVPRPPFWSGFRVVPDRIEFWTNRQSRLHDRDLWTLTPNGWSRSMLYP
jgi:pyridoxamine 5'-phosphate oxidase